MQNYKIYLNNDDITSDIISFNYSENLDDVASHFSFSSIKNYGITSVINNKKSINQIRIFDANNLAEPFYIGYITDFERTTDKNIYNYSGYDCGFYLNKNEVLIQFNNANILNAIKTLCKEYEITANKIPNFKANVSKIYKDVIFSDVIKELMELEKIKGGISDAYIDCKKGFNIFEYQVEQNLTALITDILSVPSSNTYKDISVKQSIEELKNRVVITDNDAKSLYKLTKSDDVSIKTYGLLTAIESVDTNKTNNLDLYAKNKLNELNKVAENIDLSLLGDYRISKGKIIDINIGEYNLSGIYLIISAEHTISSNTEKVRISIQKYNKK